MPAKPEFLALEPVHQTRGRLRLRYRRRADAPHSLHATERAIAEMNGIRSVRTNAAARALIVEYDPDIFSAEQCLAALRTMPASGGVRRSRSAARAEKEVGIGSVLLPAGAALSAGLRPQARIQKPLATVVASPLLREAIGDLFERGLTSHVLEALAVSISIFRNDPLAANTTSFLLALGEYLEASIERRSDELLKDLLKPTDKKVWVERDGGEVQLDPLDIKMGDIVIAATGSVIAIDGTILGGSALVNEATMTGENLPVKRARGDHALSGTLVTEGRIRIYAERVGRNCAAMRIAEFVEDALGEKSETQLKASHMADQLVPMVLGLAAFTWLVSRDWERVAAVLQADYSCALKLSTPVAFKSAMYQSGKSGILIKGAQALERLAEADTFVFDKTGTLSSGDLEMTDSIVFQEGYTPEDLINLAASVEEHYFHPLAQAVVEASRRLDQPRHFDHKEVEFIVAHGVVSVINGKRIVVGSRHFVEDDEKICFEQYEDTIEKLRQEGKTLLYIGFGGKLLGVLALRDSLRDNSALMISRLREMGAQRILMLTGDHQKRAKLVARELQLDDYHAGLMPEEKAAILKRLKDEGARVAFIGDGVNDAPALSGAHVGISMHRGADIARLAADIALLEDNIERVADAREMALATQRLINSNFKLTVGLNSAVLLGAAFGSLGPMAASALHNGSTVGILLRALGGAGLPRKKPD